MSYALAKQNDPSSVDEAQVLTDAYNSYAKTHNVPDEFAKQFKVGMQVVARTGVRVNPLTRRFSLTPRTAVNYMLVAARAGGEPA